MAHVSRQQARREARINKALSAAEWVLWGVVGFVAYHAGSAWWTFFQDYN